jgi:hypothetical protein
MSHTSLSSEKWSTKYECEESDSIPFLDILCRIKDGKIVTDLYKIECTNNIPFSLAMMKPEAREGRFVELKQLLVELDCRLGMIDEAIFKARAVLQAKALKWSYKRERTTNILQTN